MNDNLEISCLIEKVEKKLETYGYAEFSCLEYSEIIPLKYKAEFEKKLRENYIFKFPIDYDSFWLIKTGGSKLQKSDDLESLKAKISQPLYFKPVTIDIGELNLSNLISIMMTNKIFNKFLKEEELIVFNNSFSLKEKEFKVRNHNDKILTLLLKNHRYKKQMIIESKTTIYLIGEDLSKKFPEIFYSNIYFSEKYDKKVEIINLKRKDTNVEISLGFFKNYDNFNSVVLQKRQSFTLRDFAIEKIELISEFESIERKQAYITFPQADNIEIIYSLTDYIDDEVTYDEIAQIFNIMGSNIVDRQVSYYITAAIYIDLLTEIGNRKYKMTLLGKSLKLKDSKDRKLSFMLAVLTKPVFYETFNLYIETDRIPNRAEIVNIMKEEIPELLSESTFSRRASTVRSWLSWIISDLI